MKVGKDENGFTEITDIGKLPIRLLAKDGTRISISEASIGGFVIGIQSPKHSNESTRTYIANDGVIELYI